MKRRQFITTAAGGAVAASLAAPAVAQAPSVKWRLTTSWPKSLDTMQGAIENVAKRVGELTEGRFDIRVFAAGEIVPGLQVFDAVQNGTVESGHSYSSFYFGKRPAYVFDGGLAFGPNARQFNAWLQYGGGLAAIREVFAKDGVVPFPATNVGVQMGGFYRKEINAPEDLRGLKMRIGGLGGRIMAKLGAVPQQIAPGDIYPSLERGAIDAAEFIGPYDDEKLGLHKVAKFYYTPGWWEGSANNSMLVNKAAWDALPPSFKAAFEVACNEATLLATAKYDTVNGPALQRLAAAGTQIKQFPRAVMDAAYVASFEVFEEIAATDADFKKLYGPWKHFLEESNFWFRVGEYTLDSYRFSKPLPK